MIWDLLDFLQYRRCKDVAVQRLYGTDGTSMPEMRNHRGAFGCLQCSMDWNKIITHPKIRFTKVCKILLEKPVQICIIRVIYHLVRFYCAPIV